MDYGRSRFADTLGVHLGCSKEAGEDQRSADGESNCIYDWDRFRLGGEDD
jgi:hypothetical protein